MYSPPHFEEDRPAEFVALIEHFPLAIVIRNAPDGLTADHVPLLHEAVPASAGKLIGHVAKSNPLWQHSVDQEVLVVFQGPSAYISPNWYATKRETGKVVPTWNYAVVHAYCSLHAIQEPERVMQIVIALTERHEAAQSHPWRVDDAPVEFTAKLLGSIVGIELIIHRWQGKWKVSQNQPEQNRRSVAENLVSEGLDTHVQMAALVRSRAAK